MRKDIIDLAKRLNRRCEMAGDGYSYEHIRTEPDGSPIEGYDLELDMRILSALEKYLISQDSVREDIFDHINQERLRQDQKWGVQRHPFIYSNSQRLKDIFDYYGLIDPGKAKHQCDSRADNGTLTWTDILYEEFTEWVESVHNKSKEEQREELIQLVAVAVAALEQLDKE